MIRTGHYGLPYFEQGDFYGADSDRERMVITDNQLIHLARLVGDGVFSGWTVCHVEEDSDLSTLEIEIHPGIGFINGIVHRTLSIKKKIVQSNVQTNVYMQSQMLNPIGSLKVETEGPASNLANATFIDVTPPATPTGLAAAAVDFQLINLAWNANSESDFDHYELWRATVSGGPYTMIAEPLFNGVIPAAPYQDDELSSITTYYYIIYAVDISGNTSAPSSEVSATTLPDTTQPAEPAGLQVFPGNSTISIIWDASATANVVYRITKQALSLDGSVASTTVYDNIPTIYWQLTGLTNEVQHRITLQAKSTGGILSDGSSAETKPANGAAPLDPLLDTGSPAGAITSLAGAIQLAWLASPSPTGSAVGQKNEYKIYVIDGEDQSAPISSIGVALTKTINSFREFSTTSIGAQKTLEDDVVYAFRITSLDVVGNESAGLYLKGTTLDLSPPADPRFLTLVAGDERIRVFWKHSSSEDVSGYVINVDVGMGYGPNIDIDYLEKYILTGLTNGDEVFVKLRAKDDAGNLSTPGVIASATPLADTIAPAIPQDIQVTPEDQQVVITWEPNTEEDFDHYILERTAITESILTVTTRDFTVTTVLPDAIATGTVTSPATTTSVTSADFEGLPDQTGNVLFLTSGVVIGENSVISSFNSVTGTATLATPLSFEPDINDNLSIKIAHPSLGVITRDVGTANEILDIGLVNGQTYVYTVKAVDERGNESEFSAPFLVAPTCGRNDLNAPSNLVATFGSGTITLTWDQIVLDAEHPATDHTAFNIYRSTVQDSGFELIESLPPTVLTYVDSDLINGETYYYIVTAVRDTAEAIIDTGALPPPATVLLATLKINSSTPIGCNITEIENQQRLLDQLQASIEEETSVRLLNHKHSVAPINRVTVEAVPLLAMIEAITLVDFDFTGLSLSAETLAYYNSIITDKTGEPIPYDTGVQYVISPSSIVSGMPYVGDFQILVNGEKPTVEFTIDENRNMVIFSAPFTTDDVMTLDGSGFSYYVPAKIDLGYRGFDVLLNDVSISNVSVDEPLQTLRFSEAREVEDIISVVIDPAIPDFGLVPGARQVSLSPNIVLNDFTTINRKLYTSTGGNFDSTDTFFVLVDGERTSLQHVVDTTLKTIVFDEELPKTAVVSLEVLNREEVQGLLPVTKFGPIDGSTFTTGKFIKPQLPAISHEGRINEPALPIFQTLTSFDKYVWQAETGIVGTATTPYSIHQFDDGSLLLGTSSGLLKTTGFAAFNSEGEDTEITVNYSVTPPAGLKFESATPDDVVTKTRDSVKYSGRFNGYLSFTTTTGAKIALSGPNMTELDDGRILISGGAILNEVFGAYFEQVATYIYDPADQSFKRVGDMFNKRRDHSAARLPDGNVLVCGGSYFVLVHFNTTTFSPDATDTIRINTAEIFDIITETWVPAADMNVDRDYHSCTLINDSEVLIAGGNTGISSYNGLFRPPLDTYPVPASTAEIYDFFAGTWTLTNSMNRTRVNAEANSDGGVLIVAGGGQEGRDVYDRATEKWTLEGKETEATLNSINDSFGPNSIDGPVKQFLTDSFDLTLLVTRNSVYASEDGATFIKTKGLESVGVVHRIAESSNGTLYAATDLGVYEMTTDIHDQLTWFQGGLIGSGTTETFDLQSFGTLMLAATEIGIFYTTTLENGDVWTQLNTDGTIFEDVFNIELVGSILFLNAGNDLYRSDSSGATWTKIGTFNFIDPDAKLVARDPLDLFVVSSTGLYATRDGVEFFLVDFDINRRSASNNIQMAQVLGTDLIVGYDNVLLSVGPEFETIVLAEFVGTVPTVLINDIEARNGFRYDTKNGQIVFEVKRFVDDVVKVTSNYGIYKLVNGPWYRQNQNASVIVLVNGKIKSDDTMSINSNLGQITFNEDLTKRDSVLVSIAGTSLKNEGELFHSELEDRFEQEKGLPLSMGRDYAGNLLQMGLSIEHNFLERGIERNQYYCSSESLVDRSFTSFLQNAEFYIMGRREFDRFNSTIDYQAESEQTSIGTRALTPLSALEVSGDLWIGTENGIFVLDPSTPSFAISKTIDIEGIGNSIRDLEFFQGNVLAVTERGLYKTEDLGLTFTRNDGFGLPGTLLTMASINNVLLLGTEDAIYYSDGANLTPAYSIWFKAAFAEKDTAAELFINEACNSFVVGDGIAYAAIDRGIYISTNGKSWTHVFDFPKETTVLTLAYFARKLFAGTNKGVYSDNGSARSPAPAFKLEITDVTATESEKLSVNDMFVHTDGNVTSLYVVGNKGNVYRLTNQSWTPTVISGITAIQKFIIVSGPKQVAIANDSVFVQ